MSNIRKKAQAGFTLIELLVALALLSTLAFLASNAFDGSRSKAQTMIGLSRQVADANIQLKTDTGCYVNRPSALFDPNVADARSNNFCNAIFGRTWARPYLGQYPVNEAGEILADKIGAGVTVAIRREQGGMTNGSGKRYFIHFENVPKDVIKQALIECNNTDERQGDFNFNTCRTTSSLSDDSSGDFDFLYDTTR